MRSIINGIKADVQSWRFLKPVPAYLSIIVMSLATSCTNEKAPERAEEKAEASPTDTKAGENAGEGFSLVTSAPAFSVAPGSYNTAQTVTITSATAGATIRYTGDGTWPTASVGTVYSGPVSISSMNVTTTLRAKAFKSGSSDSLTTSAVYKLENVAPTLASAVLNETTIGAQKFLTWTKATDANPITYQVRQSASNNISIIADAEANGTLITPVITSHNSNAELKFPLTGLVAPGTTSYFNIIARDAAGNKSIYTSKAVTFGADATPPVPGGSGNINYPRTTDTSMRLSWVQATDNMTPKASLQYEVRRSLSNNINNIANAETNGTVVTAYTADLTSVEYTGLSAGTNYYFAVIVKDSAGNKGYYGAATSTLASLGGSISSLSNTTTTEPSSQRKTFYDSVNDRHWAFYYNGSDLENAYSADGGTTWTKTASPYCATPGGNFAVTYKAISGVGYVFIASYCSANRIDFTRGVLSADDVTYNSWQVPFNGTSATDAYSQPTISISNTSNHVWVGATYRGAYYGGMDTMPVVRRSTNAADGDLSSWESVTNIGELPIAGVKSVVMLPGAGDHMALIVNSASINAYTYNGTSWTTTNSSDYGWATTFVSTGVSQGVSNGSVLAVASIGDVVYIGGTFTNAFGDPDADYIVQWDGTRWKSLSSGVSSPVRALAVSGADLIVGGQFTSAGGMPANSIAKWNGNRWMSLGAGVNNIVYAIAVSGNNIYAGGTFTTAAGAPANRIAKFDGSKWSGLGTGIYGATAVMNINAWFPTVRAISISGSDIYVGGDFSTAGGVPASNIAKWNGSSWSALGLGTNSTVHAIATMGGNVYAGGDFTIAGGNGGIKYIGKWNGTTWTVLGGGVDNTVHALAVAGGTLYVGGSFDYAESYNIFAPRIAKWSGTAWSASGSGLSGGSGVYALHAAGDLYAAGSLTGNVSKLATGGSSWSPVSGTGSASSNSWVNAMAASGTDIYVAGQFTMIGGVAVSNIAKWNGSSWSALGSGLNGAVYSLAVSGSDLYAGGEYGASGATSVSRIAKWNGTSWSALGTGLNGRVLSIATNGSDVYAAGEFAAAGGASASRIAKWNGSAWSALGTGLGSGYPRSVAVTGNDVYVTGDFTSAGGASASRIAKWNGSTWSALGTGLNAGGYTVAVSGTDVYVGGDFTTAGGVTVNRIAKWNGSTWSALGSGVNGTVNSIVANGSDVYVAGTFTQVGGSETSHRVGKWNGSTWSAMASTDQGFGWPQYAQQMMLSGNTLFVSGNVHGRFATYDMTAGSSKSSVSAVTDNSGNIHMTYVDSVSGKAVYKNYNGTTWSAATNLSTATTATNPVISINPANGNMWTWWMEASTNKLMQKLFTGSWGSESTIFNIQFSRNGGLSADANYDDGKAKVMWTSYVADSPVIYVRGVN
jgi:hypothetical protein